MDDRGLFFSSWSVVTASSSRLPRPQPGAIHRRDIDARRQKITCPAASRSSGAVGFGMDSMEPRLPSRGSPISSPRPHPFGMAWPGESSFLVPVSCQPSQILEGLLTMPSRRVLVPGDPRSRWETCSRGERGRKFWMDRLPGLLNVRPEFCVQSCRGLDVWEEGRCRCRGFGLNSVSIPERISNVIGWPR